MPQRTAEQVLADCFWGWQPGMGGESFHMPLLPTDRFPRLSRGCGNIGGVTGVQMPPYLAAEVDGGLVHVNLWEGDGRRVGYDRQDYDASAFIYADSVDMPEEWKQPIAEALEEIREHCPGVPLVFRPEPDVDQKALESADA